MPRMILNQETSEKIQELLPIVAAMNSLQKAYDIATGFMFEKPVDEHDEGVRDLAHHHLDALLQGAGVIASDYNLEIRFNRTNGEFVLLDQEG